MSVSLILHMWVYLRIYGGIWLSGSSRSSSCRQRRTFPLFTSPSPVYEVVVGADVGEVVGLSAGLPVGSAVNAPLAVLEGLKTGARLGASLENLC